MNKNKQKKLSNIFSCKGINTEKKIRSGIVNIIGVAFAIGKESYRFDILGNSVLKDLNGNNTLSPKFSDMDQYLRILEGK